MAQNTAIQWTHHTFNPWWGCQNVSPGCDHCYAEAWDKRVGGAHWGPHAPRRIMSDHYWKQPLKWDKTARAAGERHRVFCASMADVWDNKAPEGQRERLWGLIRVTPNLDWLLLTKRPQNIAKMHPGGHYPNVWLGTTTEDQERLDQRITYLVNNQAEIHFLSVEPMLGPVTIRLDFWRSIRWVIVGGESGPGARPCQTMWIHDIIGQCRDAGIPAFVKQLGSIVWHDDVRLPLIDRKGGNIDEWPEHLRVREYPQVPA